MVKKRSLNSPELPPSACLSLCCNGSVVVKSRSWKLKRKFLVTSFPWGCKQIEFIRRKEEKQKTSELTHAHTRMRAQRTHTALHNSAEKEKSSSQAFFFLFFLCIFFSPKEKQLDLMLPAVGREPSFLRLQQKLDCASTQRASAAVPRKCFPLSTPACANSQTLLSRRLSGVCW